LLQQPPPPPPPEVPKHVSKLLLYTARLELLLLRFTPLLSLIIHKTQQRNVLTKGRIFSRTLFNVLREINKFIYLENLPVHI
jgi:hypothetical protein